MIIFASPSLPEFTGTRLPLDSVELVYFVPAYANTAKPTNKSTINNPGLNLAIRGFYKEGLFFFRQWIRESDNIHRILWDERNGVWCKGNLPLLTASKQTNKNNKTNKYSQ